MVCFFSVEALHHRRIKIFDDREAWFQKIVRDQEAAEAESVRLLGEAENCARDQE